MYGAGVPWITWRCTVNTRFGCFLPFFVLVSICRHCVLDLNKVPLLCFEPQNFNLVSNVGISCRPQSIEWFIENQAFLRTYDLAPRPPPSPPPPVSKLYICLCLFLCLASRTYWRERGKGASESQIIRPRESLALYKLFNTLGCKLQYFSGKLSMLGSFLPEGSQGYFSNFL